MRSGEARELDVALVQRAAVDAVEMEGLVRYRCAGGGEDAPVAEDVDRERVRGSRDERDRRRDPGDDVFDA